jgi:alanine racemase
VAGRLSAPAEAAVDLERLFDNYRAVAALAAGRQVVAVVKADAYGHGAGDVSRCLEQAGVAMLAVAFLDEAVALRAAGVRAPILVLAGCLPGQAEAFVEHALTPVVGSVETLEEALAASRRGRGPWRVHVEVDTGMARLGFAPKDVVGVAQRLLEAGLVLEGVMTQLAAADEDGTITGLHLDRFDTVLSDLARHGLGAPYAHAANSAGLLHLRPSHTAVRPGLLLYGIRPRPLGPTIAVEPVLSVSARVLHVRAVGTGTPVSYGGRWRARRASRVATLAFGYADGMPRTETASERGFVMLRGVRAPIVGAVCMDFTLVDVTDIPSVVEGDQAVVLGESPSAWDLAEWAGTNPWQILTAIGPRVKRVSRAEVGEAARRASG